MEMESELLLPKPTYMGIKKYLRRKHYNLNGGTATSGKKMKMIRSMIIDNIFGGKWIPKGRLVSMDYSNDAFEARLIYEISRALVASHQLHPM
ncbi:hypothetical protein VNO77_21643 [Canavalia gladiata]|uniref:Uncharacterized protein n=1 Tax=Canavalia gladiata TaxID=3824 RepID=A0AAN9QKH3_CANGL